MDDSTENSDLHKRDESTEDSDLPESYNISYFPEELLKKILGYLDPYYKINFIKVSKGIQGILYRTLAQDFITLNEIDSLIRWHYPFYVTLYSDEEKYYDQLVVRMLGSNMGPLKEIQEKYKLDFTKLLTLYQKIRGEYVVTYETLFHLLGDYKNKSKITKQPFDSVMRRKSNCYKACSPTAIKMNTVPWFMGMSSFVFFLGSIAGMMALSILAAQGTVPSGAMNCYSPEGSNSPVCYRWLSSSELAAAITLPFAFIIFGSTALAYCCNLDLCCIRQRSERNAPLKYDKAQAGQIKNSIFYKAKPLDKASILLKAHSIFKEKTESTESIDIAIPMNDKFAVDGRNSSSESEHLSMSN